MPDATHLTKHHALSTANRILLPSRGEIIPCWIMICPSKVWLFSYQRGSSTWVCYPKQDLSWIWLESSFGVMSCHYRSCHSWSVWHVYGGSSLKWSPWVSGSHCQLESRLLFCALPRDQEACSAWLSLKSFTNLLDVLKSIQPRRNGLSGMINYGVNCHGVIFYRILDFHFLLRMTDLCVHCVPRRARSIWALGGIWILASQRKKTSSSLPKIFAHACKDENNYNRGYWNYSCKLCFSPGSIS